MKQLILALLILAGTGAFAQTTENDSVRTMVSEQVSGFLADYWDAYNQCNIEKLLSSESEDIEFYHDMGGLDAGKEKSRESWKQFCSNTDWRVTAEWDGNYEISPMFNRDQLYGAIVTGNLKFHGIKSGDNQKQFIGKSRYIVFLNYNKDSWQMHRVFSYDHK